VPLEFSLEIKSYEVGAMWLAAVDAAADPCFEALRIVGAMDEEATRS
jgi:hypothetical protein